MWLICPQITGVPQESLVTVVKSGLPTSADLYVLPLESKPAKQGMFVDKVTCRHNMLCSNPYTTEATLTTKNGPSYSF